MKYSLPSEAESMPTTRSLHWADIEDISIGEVAPSRSLRLVTLIVYIPPLSIWRFVSFKIVLREESYFPRNVAFKIGARFPTRQTTKVLD